MNFGDLKNLDVRSPGEWPSLAKTIAVGMLCVVGAVAWYYYDIQEQYAVLERVEREELDLRRQFETKQKKLVNLELYKEQLEDLRQALGAMIRQLPDKTEIAGLLVDVSQSGLAAGLEFELFRPEAELPKEFYAEKPIQIRVVGSYHEFGEFVSSLAAMPRIVTIHDIRIAPRDDGDLTMDAVAKTYRYLDEGSGG
jgi:type IV pilus assembly protein PilO